MLKRQAGCPLCGAKLMARDWLGASTGLLDAELGVLAARCPYCQGYLELRPLAGRVDIGYLVGKGNVRFEVALTLPYASLTVEYRENAIQLCADDGSWEWSA